MTDSTLRTLKNLRQSRQFDGSSMDDADLQRILEIARWTGSSRNSQPWQLVVVDDSEQLKRLAHVRELNIWMQDAAVAVAIVLPGDTNVSHSYDEGRLSERMMLAADVLGYGSGTAWYTNEQETTAAKEILQVPADATLRSLVVIGRVRDEAKSGGKSGGGRKRLDEIVSYNTFGTRDR
jgi:nitroreductase